MKRAVAFVLTLALIICMAPSVFAILEPNKVIVRFDENVTDVFYQYRSNAATRPERTGADDQIIIPFRQTGFWDADDNLIVWDSDYPTMGPTRTQLLHNRVGVRMEVLAGEHVIRDVEIVEFTPTRAVETRSAIRIRFVEDYVSTAETEYRFTITLTLDGKATHVKETFGGKIYNEVIEIGNDEDFVDTHDGVVVECDGTTDNIQVYLGNNVSIYTNMIKGEKYYGIARVKPTDKDLAIYSEYPQVEAIYNLSTINLVSVSSYVAFDLPESYFVYNVEGKYLGLSTERLPYSSKYYLTTEMIDDFEVDVDGGVAAEVNYDFHPELRRFLKMDDPD